MKKSISITIISFLLISTLCAVYTWAQEPPERPMRRDIRGMLKELNLTEQQKEKLANLRLESQKEMVKLRADLRMMQLDLRALLDTKEINKVKVYAEIDKITNLRNEMMKKRIDFMLKRKAVFTPEQWEKVKPLVKYRRTARMFRRQRDHDFRSRLGNKVLLERRWNQ